MKALVFLTKEQWSLRDFSLPQTVVPQGVKIATYQGIEVANVHQHKLVDDVREATCH